MLETLGRGIKPREWRIEMAGEPESKLDRFNKIMWLVSGIVTAVLVIAIMIIILIKGTGY
ncbi:MAG TPA: hypothetical protein VLY45_07785 [Nitrospiria bacterium]|nr:hypothetical protein [Nitrospiria bacterium]